MNEMLFKVLCACKHRLKRFCKQHGVEESGTLSTTLLSASSSCSINLAFNLISLGEALKMCAREFVHPPKLVSFEERKS